MSCASRDESASLTNILQVSIEDISSKLVSKGCDDASVMLGSQNGIAQYIFNEMCDVEVLHGAHALLTVTNEMNHLTKFTQSLDINYYDVAEDIRITKQYLQEHFVSLDTAFVDGVVFKQWNVLAEDVDSPLQWMEVDGVDSLVYEVHIAGEFHSSHVMTSKEVRSRSGIVVSTMRQFNDVKCRVQAEMKVLAERLLQDFADRFPPSSLMEAMAIFHPTYWNHNPSDDEITLMLRVVKEQYGTDRTLVDGSKVLAIINFDKVEDEAWFFRAHMRRTHRMHNNARQLWAEADAIANCRVRMPETMQLARLVESIPVGSVQNERRFSLMTAVRSKARNRLQEQHLNVCMRISAASKQNVTYREFNVAHAVKRWMDKAVRRNLSR